LLYDASSMTMNRTSHIHNYGALGKTCLGYFTFNAFVCTDQMILTKGAGKGCQSGQLKINHV